MSAHPFVWLDVFTHSPLEGNGLAVVQDADGLDDATMQRFARETKLSETTFVQSATEPGADYRNRIFTPVEEVPFAGHPSLGTAVAVARMRGDLEASYVQQTHAGLQPVEVWVEGERSWASVLQEPAVFGPAVAADAALAAVGLGCHEGDPALGPQLVSTGLPTLILPVLDAAAVARAQPDHPAIEALLRAADAINMYLVACDPAAGRAHARTFSRLLVEGEDPATGSAAGPLCAYLAEHADCRRVEITQGVEMGRPSRLLAALDGERVRVSGGVAWVAEGTVHLPDSAGAHR